MPGDAKTHSRPRRSAHWYDALAVVAAVLLIAIAWDKGNTQGPSPAWTGPAGIVAILLVVAYAVLRYRREGR